MADSDPRFARLKTDPRFRKPRRKETKVKVDPRFKSLFDNGAVEKGKRKAHVDKYGRNQSKTHQRDQLLRFYRLDDDASEQESKGPDYARGEILVESSDEEGHSEDAAADDVEVVLERPTGKKRKPSSSADLVDIDLDESAFPTLEAEAIAYSKSVSGPPRTTALGEETSRLAVVNLDWDHVRASDLFKVFSSVITEEHGHVVSVRIYPSEFGKERMKNEEVQGPPLAVFRTARLLQEEDEVNKRNIIEVDEGEEYDNDALRKYQLDRLRYYYAIVTCDSPATAAHIYSELDETELERSANVFDLRFVPDSMKFVDEIRDEATEDAGPSHKGLDFSTDALRHSKVRLTWDDDDPNRNRLTRRALSRKEIEEADFKAYIASSASEDDDDAEQRRQKLRSLLFDGAGDESLPDGWSAGPHGTADMEITFMPGLTEAASQHVDLEDESPLELYQRKQRERKQAKKASRANPSAKDHTGTDSEDFFARASDKDSRKQNDNGAQVLPPVMTTEELSLIITPPLAGAIESKHFDMNAVVRAQKAEGKKRMRGKRSAQEQEAADSFVVDLEDDRFQILHKDSAFALDPSHPRFKKTKGMSALLDERARRQHVGTREPAVAPAGGKTKPAGEDVLERNQPRRDGLERPKSKKRRM